MSLKDLQKFTFANYIHLLYGCETWKLTETLIEKLDIYASACFRIMLGIEQSRDQVTNQSLYQLTGQVPLSERHLKFTGHCIRMPTDEPAYQFVIYESMIRSFLRPGAPRTKYLNKISSHIQLQSGVKSIKAEEIGKMASEKSDRSQLFVVSKKKPPG